jgi:hypothetical protein
MYDSLDIDPANFQRQDAADAHLLVVFYMGTVTNEERSLEEGRLIVDDHECVKIMIPGDKNTVVDRPATKHDKKRFAQQYAAFRQGKEGEDQLSGTRLADWPFLSRGQVEELRFIGIKTVEQLSNVADSVNFPGLQQLKTHARSWLATAKDSALAAQQGERLNAQDAKINELMKVIEDQTRLLADMQRGRKAA